MSDEKVAVVTGSNKGIGFAIVKGLCENFDGIVYLTSREISRGETAVAELKKLGLNPSFHQLDIESQESVDNFRDFLKDTHGGIDVLINNAGIAFKNDSSEPFAKQAEETICVNYFGTLRVCEALFPLLRTNARVINISSVAGFLANIPSAELRAKLSDPNLTVSELNTLMEKFIQDAKEGEEANGQWGGSCYVASKVGVSALSIVQQRLFDEEQPNKNIAVNHVHPGYIDTDMTSHKGPLTIEQGAKAPLFLALEADFKGKYVWHDCQVVDWYGKTTPRAY